MNDQITVRLLVLAAALAFAPPVARAQDEPAGAPLETDDSITDADAEVPSDVEAPADAEPPADAGESAAPADLAAAPTESAAAGAQSEAQDSEEPGSETHTPPGEIEMFEAHIAENVDFRPGRGLSIRSDDEQFELTTRFRLQILYRLMDEPGSEVSHELTLRRARLGFSGHFFGDDNRFKLELALSPSDEGIRDVFDNAGPTRTPLLDYYLEFRQLRELNVRIGQFKVPYNREYGISSADLEMIDRSIVHSAFSLDRDVGIDLRSPDLFGLGLFRYDAGVYIGQGRDAVGADDFGLLYAVRFEVLPLGLFDDYSEADFARSLTPRLSIGAAFAAIDRAHRDRGILGSAPADGGTTNTQHVAADVVFMVAGLRLFAEFLLRVGRRNSGDAVDEMGMQIPTDPSVWGWGLVSQVGYLLPDLPIEIATRYATTQPLRSPGGVSVANELGLAVSYYVGRHPFKVQIDGFRLWGDQFDVGETRLRIQVQASL